MIIFLYLVDCHEDNDVVLVFFFLECGTGTKKFLL